jgi:hypothetical protein
MEERRRQAGLERAREHEEWKERCVDDAVALIGAMQQECAPTALVRDPSRPNFFDLAGISPCNGCSCHEIFNGVLDRTRVLWITSGRRGAAARARSARCAQRWGSGPAPPTSATAPGSRCDSAHGTASSREPTQRPATTPGSLRRHCGRSTRLSLGLCRTSNRGPILTHRGDCCTGASTSGERTCREARDKGSQLVVSIHEELFMDVIKDSVHMPTELPHFHSAWMDPSLKTIACTMSVIQDFFANTITQCTSVRLVVERFFSPSSVSPSSSSHAPSFLRIPRTSRERDHHLKPTIKMVVLGNSVLT